MELRTPEDFIRDAQAEADRLGQGKKFRAAFEQRREHNGVRGAGLLALRDVDVPIPEAWRPGA